VSRSVRSTWPTSRGRARRAAVAGYPQRPVVFVTTDPGRDTPERIRKWLDRFDSDFIGLTGSEKELMGDQTAAGLKPASREFTNQKHYAVGHAVQVLAYTRDDSLRVIYPSATRQQDWEQDIPLLQRFEPKS
jgi:protein SCO1/2